EEGEDSAPDVSPDGEKLVYLHSTRSTAVFALDLATGARRQLTHELLHGHWLAAGDHAVYQEISRYAGSVRRALIGRIPLDGGELEVLGEGSVPAVAPDGSLVYATSAPEGSVLWARRDGEAARELARFEGEVMSVAAGADALWLSVRAKAAREVYRLPLT